MPRVRVRVKSKVIVELTSKHAEILEDMGLVDESGAYLQGVRMQGVVKAQHRNSFDVFCGAAEEDVNVVCKNVVAAATENAPNYYVVLTNNAGEPTIKSVTGLLLPKPVAGYHLDKQDAVAEQQRLLTANASCTTNTTAGNKYYLLKYVIHINAPHTPTHSGSNATTTTQQPATATTTTQQPATAVAATTTGPTAGIK